jgi:hypothetical protein
MIYGEHNFTENFCNASGNEDSFMLNDIVIDELARHIVENKNDVVAVLRRSGINVTVNDNNKVVATALTREIAKGNYDVTKDVASQIVKSRFDLAEFKKLSADGDIVTDGDNTFWKNVWTSTKDVGTTLIKDENVQDAASSYLSDLMSKTYSTTNPTTTTNNQSQLYERLMVNQAQQKSKLNVKGLLIVTGIVAIAGFLVFKIFKASKES